MEGHGARWALSPRGCGVWCCRCAHRCLDAPKTKRTEMQHHEKSPTTLARHSGRGGGAARTRATTTAVRGRAAAVCAPPDPDPPRERRGRGASLARQIVEPYVRHGERHAAEEAGRRDGAVQQARRKRRDHDGPRLRDGIEDCGGSGGAA